MSEFTDRLDEEMRKKNLNISRLSKQTGIASSTIRGWYLDRMPSADTALIVADCLDTSLDYLVAGKEKEEPAETQDDAKTTEERLILKLYRSLKESDRFTILLLLKSLSTNNAEELEKLQQLKKLVNKERENNNE